MITTIVEEKAVVEYLLERNLSKQYQKAKYYLLHGNAQAVSFKKRQPKTSGIWSFRINHQFRAVGYFIDANTFLVSYIDNHQSS